MRPLSGRHAAGGFKITTLGRGGFAPRVLRVRHERRTSLTGLLREFCGVATVGEMARSEPLAGSGELLAAGARDVTIWYACGASA